MWLAEMTVAQRDDLTRFEAVLGADGWELEPFAGLLRDGAYVYPEGLASRDVDGVSLALELYADARALELVVTRGDDARGARLTPRSSEALGELLEWVVRRRDHLRPETFAASLEEVRPFCDVAAMQRDAGAGGDR